MTTNRCLLLMGAVSLAIPLCMAQEKDAEGCKDSPLIGRFPGSVIQACKDKADDVFEFTMGNKPKKRLEGEFHQLTYNWPTKTASKAQVVRNLNTALHKAGYIFD